MSPTITVDELRAAGLLAASPQPQLTNKGRSWLRTLEDVETQEVVDTDEVAADLVLSTNGLFR